jgi:UDP-GlcNAc:undecaprenyl-phosphate GlcNAc-1-phosphate transferase
MENTTQTFFLNVVVFIGAVIFSLISNQVLLRLIRTSATKSISPEMIRWNTAKPAVGGISFFMTFLLSFTIAGIIFQGDSIFKSYFHLSLIATCSMAFLMGLADDAYNTKPWLKFLVQFACGLFLIVFNQHIKIFDNEWLNYTITMVWVIGIMNSINMLDNMDAITTSVSAFILLNALALLYVSGRANEVVFVILLGLLGALVGFLFFNWHPSKLYMGDTGSSVYTPLYYHV